MTNLEFNSIEEVTEFFTYQKSKVNDCIFDALNSAISNNKTSAKLFEVTVTNSEYMVDITLPKKRWSATLKELLKFYEKEGTPDQCIDTWQLINKIKTT